MQRYNAFRALILVPLSVLGVGQGALAQSVTLPQPLIRSQVDEYEVDLVSRQLQLVEEGPSIGDVEQGGLQHVRLRSGANWRHDFLLAGSYKTDQYTYQVTERSFAVGRQRYDFTVSGSSFINKKGDGATLAATTAAFTLTLRDGTVVVFDRTLAAFGSSYYGVADGVGTTIAHPSGLTTTLTYKADSYNYDFGGGSTFPMGILRLQSVANNQGYQLKYSYATNAPTQQNVDDWYRITKVQAINLATEYCAPAADTCSLSQSWPQEQYARSVTGTTVIETISDALGNQTSYTTVPGQYLGETLYIRDPGASSDRISYSFGYPAGTVSAVALAGTQPRTYDYWTNPGYLTVTDSLGRTRMTSGDPNLGVILTDKDALNRTTSFGYDTYGRLLSVTSPEGNATTLTYDSRGNVLSKSLVAKPGSGTPTSTFQYGFPSTCGDPKTCNSPIWARDSKNNQTDITYDPAHGQTLTVTAPADATGVRPQTRFSYAALQASYRNATGAIVASGQAIYKTSAMSACMTGASCIGTAAESRKSIGYGSQGAGVANNLQPVTVTAAAGDGSVTSTTTAAYDRFGNLVSLDGPLAGTADTATSRFDALRRRVGGIAPDPDASAALPNVASRTTYDAVGRVTLEEEGTTPGQGDADWSAFTTVASVASVYDLAGRKLVETRRGSDGVAVALAQYGYDGAGRLECIAHRMNPSAFTSLPAACSLGAQGSDGPDRIRKSVYNVADEVTSILAGYGTPAQVTELSQGHSANGRVNYILDANNNRTSYQYDGLDRLTRTTYPSQTLGAGSSNTSDFEEFGYDSNGNLASKRTRRGETLTYQYDALDRLVAKIVPERAGLSSTHTRDVYQGYDLLGRLTFARYDGLSGEGVNHVWDPLGRLLSSNLTMDGVSRTLSYTYDAADNRTRITYPDGQMFDYVYDNMNRFTELNEALASPVYQQTYKASGPLATTNRFNVLATFGTDTVQRVDAVNLYTNMSTYNAAWALAYNPAGQLKSQVLSNDLYAWTAHATVDRGYSNNGLNQHVSASPANFVYDGNGNLQSDGTWYYTYDVENRLVAVDNGRATTLRYDPLGRLYELSDNTSGVARFLNDDQSLVSEYNASGSLLRRFVHAPGADPSPLLWYEGSAVGIANRWHFVPDRLGSSIAVYNSYGNPVGVNRYDEFGIPQSTNVGRFQFTGQAWLPEVGLYYYRSRMYSPTLGRFMQPDPAGLVDGSNLYQYVRSDPLNQTDPTGLYGENVIVVIGSTANLNLALDTGLNIGISANPGIGAIGISATLQSLAQPTVFENRGKGERGWAGKNPNPKGKPHKGVKQVFGRPGWVQPVDPQTGRNKGKERPAREGEPGYVAPAPAPPPTPSQYAPTRESWLGALTAGFITFIVGVGYVVVTTF